MKKVLVNYGGVILFYLIIIFGIIFLSPNNNSVSKPSGFSTSISTNK